MLHWVSQVWNAGVGDFWPFGLRVMGTYHVSSNFFPSTAFLRRRRKKALLRVNDRGGVWRMCILGLCRVYVRTCARTSAVNLRRYGDTPQTITIYDLIEISRRTRQLNFQELNCVYHKYNFNA